MHREYTMHAISDLLKITMTGFQNGRIIADQKAEFKESKKRLRSPKVEELIHTLTARASGQEFPVIFIDKCGICWFCVVEKDTETYIIGGPVTFSHLDITEKHRFFRYYNLDEDEGDTISLLRIQQFLSMLLLLDLSLNGRETDEGELIYGNHLAKDDFLQTWEVQKKYAADKEDEQKYHHSYQEERALQEAVRTGNIQEALARNVALMDTAGKMGTDMDSHWYNLAVTAITLITRSAIEGGLSPAEAYHLSDFYIQKLKYKDSILNIQKIVNNSVMDFTDRVGKITQRKRNSYVEACKAYINDHYRDKIRIGDIADSLGISTGHLSRLFHKEEGLTFQSYLLEYRLQRSANLLRYSKRSIGEISTYCGFPSQSYYADMFHKYTGLAPGEYRKRYKPAEF